MKQSDFNFCRGCLSKESKGNATSTCSSFDFGVCSRLRSQRNGRHSHQIRSLRSRLCALIESTLQHVSCRVQSLLTILNGGLLCGHMPVPIRVSRVYFATATSSSRFPISGHDFSPQQGDVRLANGDTNSSEFLASRCPGSSFQMRLDHRRRQRHLSKSRLIDRYRGLCSMRATYYKLVFAVLRGGSCLDRLNALETSENTLVRALPRTTPTGLRLSGEGGT